MGAEDELTQNIVTLESNQNMGAEESEESSSSSSASSSLSSDEESLSQEMMSLNAGDIAEIVTMMTDGVDYRTNEGVKRLNGDKIRKLFVKTIKENC